MPLPEFILPNGAIIRNFKLCSGDRLNKGKIATYTLVVTEDYAIRRSFWQNRDGKTFRVRDNYRTQVGSSFHYRYKTNTETSEQALSMEVEAVARIWIAQLKITQAGRGVTSDDRHGHQRDQESPQNH